jgi:sugar transferase (PEP-CTERM/EpsH1 system associated)
VVFCSNMAAYTRLPELRGLPLVVDLVDVDSEKWREYAERSRGPRRLLYHREGARLRNVERELGRRAVAVMLTTPAEEFLYRQVAPEAPSQVLGNGVDIEFFRRPADQPQPARAPHPACDVVFVGAMDYRPNVDGMVWFCEHVWPEVRSRVPDAVLRIVGRRPTPAVKALAELPGVQLHADVPDVRPYLFAARLAVVPLHVARGVQNKVLEALACETPVVASPAALKGLDPAVTDEALAAETPDEWIGAVVELLRDDTPCQRLAHAGRRYVERHCPWEQRLQPLDDLLTELLSPRATTSTPHSVATVSA